MLNKDPDNLHWKNKLEDTDDLSAKMPDKNVAWEKLHNRLRKNQNSKKFMWHWSAAACLLLALFVPLMLVRKNKNSLVNIDIGKSKLSKPELIQREPLKKDTIAAIAEIAVGKNKTEKSKISNYHNKTIDDIIKEYSETNNNQIATNKVILPVPVADSAVAATAVTVQVKKKLKVVHINELGDPVEALPDIAHHTDLHLFQLKLATQEVYNKSSVASNTTGLPVLKLKTSN